MGSYLRPVTAIFVLRNTSLWNTPSNLLWLRNTAKQLLAYIDAAEGSCVNVEMMVRLSIDSKGNDSHRKDDVNVFTQCSVIESLPATEASRSMVCHLCERQKELYATLSVNGPQHYAACDLEDFVLEPSRFPAGVEVQKLNYTLSMLVISVDIFLLFYPGA